VISNTAKENKGFAVMKRYLKAGSGPSQRFSFGNESGFETKGNDGTSNARTIANVTL